MGELLTSRTRKTSLRPGTVRRSSWPSALRGGSAPARIGLLSEQIFPIDKNWLGIGTWERMHLLSADTAPFTSSEFPSGEHDVGRRELVLATVDVLKTAGRFQ